MERRRGPRGRRARRLSRRVAPRTFLQTISPRGRRFRRSRKRASPRRGERLPACRQRASAARGRVKRVCRRDVKVPATNEATNNPVGRARRFARGRPALAPPCRTP
ncbi:hypothetical protein DB771_23300 [Burkholderia sp. AU29985]|nr:hypothetical protein EGY28_18650 [Burkholderia dolosa]PRE48194.1 hypothetical protein C6P87_16145 [Burkholderia sp. AU12872]PUA74404.1 hypothetical protein DB771_23300 [Burkholderia sp. AU29985]